MRTEDFLVLTNQNHLAVFSELESRPGHRLGRPGRKLSQTHLLEPPLNKRTMARHNLTTFPIVSLVL
ncbi:MAG: hypothetical protein D6772_14505 [Bacteroidetes bacterium]|nr:MAG: hypothetical protein D6772_14505 [Bacteroidota bacterium]